MNKKFLVFLVGLFFVSIVIGSGCLRPNIIEPTSSEFRVDNKEQLVGNWKVKAGSLYDSVINLKSDGTFAIQSSNPNVDNAGTWEFTNMQLIFKKDGKILEYGGIYENLHIQGKELQLSPKLGLINVWKKE